MGGKSTVVEIDVTKKDMPNFFVEAVTVAGGKVHTEVREIYVPPAKRVLNLELIPSAEEYKPGEHATADAIRDVCRARISAHKVPRYIWFMQQALPKNANGKFLKRELKEKLSIVNAA